MKVGQQLIYPDLQIGHITAQPSGKQGHTFPYLGQYKGEKSNDYSHHPQIRGDNCQGPGRLFSHGLTVTPAQKLAGTVENKSNRKSQEKGLHSIQKSQRQSPNHIKLDQKQNQKYSICDDPHHTADHFFTHESFSLSKQSWFVTI